MQPGSILNQVNKKMVKLDDNPDKYLIEIMQNGTPSKD
jgi:hypothetical protein